MSPSESSGPTANATAATGVSATGDGDAGATEAEAESTRRKVGLADAVVAESGTVLVTSGLGSCLGVAVYDPEADVGGLLHAMLPTAGESPGAPEKFVVDGIDALVDALVDAGARAGRLRAKVAGGANMLDLDLGGEDGSVGERNVAAAGAALERHGVALVADDVGGDRGRSLRFDPATGELAVTYAGGETVVV